MRRQAWGLVTVLLLLVPLAQASPSEGSFTVHGALRFPPKTQVAGEPLALYASDTARLVSLHVAVERMTVIEYAIPFYGVEAGLSLDTFIQGSTRTAQWVVMDATVRLLPGEHDGFLGVYTVPGARLATEEGRVEAVPAATSEIGNPETTDGENPGSIAYLQRITTPHLLTDVSGGFSYSGLGLLKLRGPDVEIQSANRTQHETGTTTGTAERTVRMLVLRFETPATVTVEGAPFQAALADGAEAAWDGVLRFTPTDGALRSARREYAADGRAAELTGAFSAHLRALGSSARMDLTGDLQETTLAPQVATTPSPAFVMSWLVVLVGAAVVAGAGSGAAVAFSFLWRRLQKARRQVEMPYTLEECVAALHQDMAAEEHERALGWIRLARRAAPASARLLEAEAFCLARLGEQQEALLRYAEANKLSSEGHAAFGAALLLREEGDEAEISRWLRDALRKTPSLVVETEEDFAAVCASPDMQGALEEAWLRHEREWLGRRRR